MILSQIEMWRAGFEKSQLEVSHFWPIDNLDEQFKIQFLDEHLNIIYSNLGIPSAINMENQRAQSIFRRNQMKKIGAI
jgi:uncharacterized protein (DUF2164 family)